ncbi:apoptosis-inducing factor 1 [Thraustotheca clavata]|uniref:Apoptosis-inducing factor 1 n=1 Tax=Thraustotheca clavata TaxID=74557 RepID=A0A1W0AAQ3_9STRA|nr:apoptosis-inducing factor 1 [Thraustotheca clavata]
MESFYNLTEFKQEPMWDLLHAPMPNLFMNKDAFTFDNISYDVQSNPIDFVDSMLCFDPIPYHQPMPEVVYHNQLVDLDMPYYNDSTPTFPPPTEPIELVLPGYSPPPQEQPAPVKKAPQAVVHNEVPGKCLREDCNASITYRGFCKTHGGVRRCRVIGCTKGSQGKNLCIAHGGGKRCNIPTCNKSAQSHGLCKAHGGGARCTFDGCGKSSQGNGLCRKHGGGRRCTYENCNNGAQRGLFCAKHGGSRHCKTDDCQRTDRGGGYCEIHRKDIVCLVRGCNRMGLQDEVGGGLCHVHCNHLRSMAEQTSPLEHNESKSMKHYPYVIVGAATAAHAAIEAILHQNPRAEILMISEETHLPRLDMKDGIDEHDSPLSDALMDSYNEWRRYITPRLEDEHEMSSSSVNIVLGKPKMHFDVENKIITLSDNAQVSYDKCLIATAGKPRPLYVLDSSKISYSLRDKINVTTTLSDFEALDRLSTRQDIHTVTIVGGGFLGTEVAVALATDPRNSHLEIQQMFVDENGPCARHMPAYLSAELTRRLKAYANVKVQTDTLVTSIKASAMGQVHLSCMGDAAEAKLTDYAVLASTQLEPDLDYAEFDGIEKDHVHGGIVANAQLEAVRDLFVAGSVASYYDSFVGRRRVDRYDHAVNSGLLAGQNMVNATKKIYRHQPMFRSHMPGIGVTCEGIGDIDSRLQTVGIWLEPPKKLSNAGSYQRGIVYYLRANKIVGILLWNAPDLLENARHVMVHKPTYDNTRNLSKVISLGPKDWLHQSIEETIYDAYFWPTFPPPPEYQMTNSFANNLNGFPMPTDNIFAPYPYPNVQPIPEPLYYPIPSMPIPQQIVNNPPSNNRDSRANLSFQEKEHMGLCLDPSCARYLSYKGLCKEHGYRRMCIIPMCTKTIQGKNKCIAHGGGKPCKTLGCPRTAQSQGLCKTHGGGARCKIDGCNKSAQSKGLCRRHGGGSQCMIDGCTTMVQRNNKCAKHNGTKKCAIDDCDRTARGGGECAFHRKSRLCTFTKCNQLALQRGSWPQYCAMHAESLYKIIINKRYCRKLDLSNRILISASPPRPPPSLKSKKSNKKKITASPPKEIHGQCLESSCTAAITYRGFCKDHGGMRKCSVAYCSKRQQSGRFCIAHGGGKRCKITNCARAAQSRGLCKAHGGGARCQAPDCEKSAQQRGFCRIHGGFVKCAIEGCSNGVQRRGKCTKHDQVRLCSIAKCGQTDRGGGLCSTHRRNKVCHSEGCNRLVAGVVLKSTGPNADKYCMAHLKSIGLQMQLM